MLGGTMAHHALVGLLLSGLVHTCAGSRSEEVLSVLDATGEGLTLKSSGCRAVETLTAALDKVTAAFEKAKAGGQFKRPKTALEGSKGALANALQDALDAFAQKSKGSACDVSRMKARVKYRKNATGFQNVQKLVKNIIGCCARDPSLDGQLGSRGGCGCLSDIMPKECKIMSSFSRSCGDGKGWNFGNCTAKLGIQTTDQCCPRTCCEELADPSSVCSHDVKTTGDGIPSTAASEAFCGALQRQMQKKKGKAWEDTCEKTAVQEDSEDGEMVAINGEGDVVVLSYDEGKLSYGAKTTASSFKVMPTMWSFRNGCSWTQSEDGDWKCKFVGYKQ